MAEIHVILLLADGAEESEATTTVDILRRAGVDVIIAGLNNDEYIQCSRDVRIRPDVKFEAVNNKLYDAVVLPGGLQGSKAFCNSKEVGNFLKQHEKEGRVIAAICAAPTALKAHGIALGKRITSYPSMKNQLSEHYQYIEDVVVIDDNIVTSRGPATVYAFGLAIVEKLLDKNTAEIVAKAMLYNNYEYHNDI